jgi:hypothetical protein
MHALLAGALVVAGCGGADLISSGSGDRFNGGVDTSVFDPKLLPPVTRSSSTKVQSLCANADGSLNVPCYPAQTVFVAGKQIKVYNLFGTSALRTTPATGSPLFPILAPTSTTTPTAYAVNGCSAGHATSPQTDAFPLDQQFTVFSGLPVTPPAAQPALSLLMPLMQVTANGTTCNDLKSIDSIIAGNEGAKVTSDAPSLQLYAGVDPTAAFFRLDSAAKVAEPSCGSAPGCKLFWYQGLIGGYLDAGRVPLATDPTSGKLAVVAMDGVIVNGKSFSNAYDDKAVILPLPPGDPAYSPVVRLRQFALPTGKSVGDYNSICAAAPCPAGSVDMTKTTDSFNTIFIVGLPQ